MTPRTIHAPAKINLGLEILGRRDDGYHEIRSVLCKITLHDTLTFEPSDDSEDRLIFQESPVTVDDEQNLILRALNAIRTAGAGVPPQNIAVRKRIPTSAGLGGASSDAAATLMAFAPELEEAKANIEALAASIGSDVPFFLSGPISLIAGRGEQLTPLPPPDEECWVVLITPDLDIPNKTPQMYRAVDPDWWSSGSAVGAFARNLPELATPIPPNVFERALLKTFPEMRRVRDRLLDRGFPFAALTGAGPTFFTMVATRDHAKELAARVRDDLPGQCHVSKLGWREPGEQGVSADAASG